MLEITVLWSFILWAGVRGERVPTQIYHFRDAVACEDVRKAHLQSAVSPRCYPVAVMLNR